MDHTDEGFGVPVPGSMLLGNGKVAVLSKPDPDVFDIETIARALANMGRFNGHTSSFYSVAQHSVYVCGQCPQEFALAGLLHDASEAFLGDIIRPLKVLPEFKVYRDLEKLWQHAILEWAGLPPELPDEVKLADNRMLMTEFRDLFPETPQSILDMGLDPYDFEIQTWTPKIAYYFFLSRWDYFRSLEVPRSRA